MSRKVFAEVVMHILNGGRRFSFGAMKDVQRRLVASLNAIFDVNHDAPTGTHGSKAATVVESFQKYCAHARMEMSACISAKVRIRQEDMRVSNFIHLYFDWHSIM